MDVVEVTPGLHMILLEFGQAYLWDDGGPLTLVDAGIAGSGPDFAAAFDRLGLRREDLRRVVLTHYHEDHAGGAAELAAWGGVEVLAHRLEAPVIRGEVPAPPPDFTPEERELHRSLGAHLLPPAPPVRVDRELDDGDVIDFGGGARVVATPGHTDGSIAVHLPAPGVLFTGDTVAHVNDEALPGVFNRDREALLGSFRRLAALDARVACVGHGPPVFDAGARLSAVAAALPG
ncbi:MBL fold metallo-hydrolase [Sphaerisporangium rufum]|uniref:MBL fold metallo-hydrolase n=1 Tax=Sphaerisporangium rufum TaxID=1381558 RepID=A0A919V765_9ACTN|nr:MBL fold metallo-hydrolase [Sphaerisporangium rufum]GII80040.1 MBL fold metallo-hydrolase [Sphaerisporangium rufum]